MKNPLSQRSTDEKSLHVDVLENNQILNFHVTVHERNKVFSQIHYRNDLSFHLTDTGEYLLTHEKRDGADGGMLSSLALTVGMSIFTKGNSEPKVLVSAEDAIKLLKNFMDDPTYLKSFQIKDVAKITANNEKTPIEIPILVNHHGLHLPVGVEIGRRQEVNIKASEDGTLLLAGNILTIKPNAIKEAKFEIGSMTPEGYIATYGRDYPKEKKDAVLTRLDKLTNDFCSWFSKKMEQVTPDVSIKQSTIPEGVQAVIENIFKSK